MLGLNLGHVSMIGGLRWNPVRSETCCAAVFAYYFILIAFDIVCILCHRPLWHLYFVIPLIIIIILVIDWIFLWISMQSIEWFVSISLLRQGEKWAILIPAFFLKIMDSYTETERSSGWQPWYSLETLKTSFNVSSEYQGCQPDHFSVSVYVFLH